MSTGKTLHLSRLSRGVGEEYNRYSHFGHHKVNVYLEPQDYFNWVEKSKKVFQLPALQNDSKLSTVPQTISISSNTNTNTIPVTSKEIVLPKTFTTRKGALLLFSEDLANKNRTWETTFEDDGRREDDGGQAARNKDQEEKEDGKFSDIDLRTVEDFSKSILAYGNQHRKQNYVQLLTKIDNLHRQFRPGFSAKRYLSIWSKFWDHSTLEKLLKNGHIQSKSLFQMARLSTFHSRSLDDLSSQPLPYRLVHTMLQTNLQGYAFLRIINNKDTENDFAHPAHSELKVFDPGPDDKTDGSQEIFYGQLDRCQQEEVLTDYLLQSTVHHAFKVRQLQSLLDTKAHQPVINLPNLPLNEFQPCPNIEFGSKPKRRKPLRAHYRKLERGKNVVLPPLVQNPAELDSIRPDSPPSNARITGKDPETGTLFPTITQKPGPRYLNQNPKICRMNMLPSIEMPVYAGHAPPVTVVDPDEDFADPFPAVPIVNVEPPTRQNSIITGSTGQRKDEHQKEFKTSEVSRDGLWTSLVIDRISPTAGFWDNKIPMDELSKNRRSMEPEDMNLLKTIEATSLSSVNVSPSLSDNSKMNENSRIMKARSQLLANSRSSYYNHRKRPIRKGFVNVSDVKGSIVQAPGGEIVHVGGSLAHKKTVLPEIPSILKDSYKMDHDLKSQQNEQSKWQTPLPDIRTHFSTSLTEATEIGTGAESKSLSSRREANTMSLLSAPKVVEMLTKSAHRVASFILDQDGTGKDLDDDIKMITREVSRVLTNKNGVSLEDGNQTRMLHVGDIYSQTNPSVSTEDKGQQRPLSEVSGEEGLGNILVTHSLKSSSSTSSQLTPTPNAIDSDELSDLMGGVKPGHLYQTASRGSSPLTIPNQRNTVHTVIKQMEVTTLQPVNNDESDTADNVRQTNSHRTNSRESKTQIHFKSKDEENILNDVDILSTPIVGRRLSQNPDLRSPSVEKRGPSGAQVESARDWGRDVPAFAGVPPPFAENGVRKNIVIKMPEIIQTDEYDQQTSTEGPDSASIDEETRRAMEPNQMIFGNANSNQETTESSDRKRLCSPCPDSDPTERSPYTSNTSKRPTPARSTSQNDANANLVPKTKKGKNTPKEEFKVSRVDYAGELKRLYSRTENTKVKLAETKHDKAKIKERKAGKAKSKPSKKSKLLKKHKKKTKSTNKSLDEFTESEDKSTNQWISEDRTTASEMDGTGYQDVEKFRQSPSDRCRNEKEDDSISTWVQDAADKVDSDVSDCEKGDNSVSSETAVTEMEEKSEEDEEKDVADDQPAETSESEEQKKMILELQRILGPKDDKIEEMPETTQTKSPEVAPYAMITSQEARAAERKARAAKRREQVERKRKEREQQLKKEKEMAERQERLRQELEEQRRLAEEERRLRKEEQEAERRRLEEEELARELKKVQELEAEKRRKEEHMRRLRQLKMQQLEEERKQQEVLKRQKEEEDERRKAEEEMVAQMAEQERIEYEERKREEEERRMREEEEKRIRQEAEAKELMEETMRLAKENAKRQAELEARFQFTQALHAEAVGLTQCQAVTRAFVFSYFDLLSLLGIENTDQQQTLLGDIP